MGDISDGSEQSALDYIAKCRERCIQEDFVTRVMEQGWTKGDILLEFFEHISDKGLESLWRDLSLSVQEEEQDKIREEEIEKMEAARNEHHRHQ